MATLALPPPAADAQATFHAMGGSATTASHADASRNSVGTTAYMTCMMRAVESRVAHRPPLARDAPAEALFHLASGAQGSKRVRNSQLQRLISRPFSTRFG